MCVWRVRFAATSEWTNAMADDRRDGADGPWARGPNAGDAEQPSGAPRAGGRRLRSDADQTAGAAPPAAEARDAAVQRAMSAHARGGRAPMVLLISAVLVGLHVWATTSIASLSRFYFEYGLQPIDLFAIYPGSLPFEELRTLVTHIGLHGGWLHLGFNVLAFLSFGSAVERAFGALGMAALFLVAGVVGGVTHGVWEIAAVELTGAIDTRHLAFPLIGASGAVSGVIGAEIVLRGRLLERASAGESRAAAFVLRTSLVFIGINAALMFLPGLNISGAAHIGGYVLGVVAALAVGSAGPRARPGGPRRIAPGAD